MAEIRNLAEALAEVDRLGVECNTRRGCMARDLEEISRLRALNAALLAVCEMARLHLSLPYPEDEPIERGKVLAELVRAITKARAAGEKGG